MMAVMFIQNADNPEELPVAIDFVPEMNFSRSPNIEEIFIVGRNNPIHHYTSGKDNLDLKLDIYSSDAAYDKVLGVCRYLASLSANDGGIKPTPRITLIMGEIFQTELWIIRNVSYQLKNFDRPNGLLPKQAYIDLQLSLDPNRNLRYRDIR